MSLAETIKIEIAVRGIELVTLRKLSTVSHALASKLDLLARQEQEALATTLDDVLRRMEIGYENNRLRHMSDNNLEDKALRDIAGKP